MKSSNWVGRFAPTPSGPLHFGSLVAALGSYLITRSQNGQWLLRIEDLDTPRVVGGATQQIIHTLEMFGFEWDSEIVYQSQRTQLYQQALTQLMRQQRLFCCRCSRQQIKRRNRGFYDGYCRNRILSIDNPNSNGFAVRIKFESGFESFYDEIRGKCHFASPADTQDFVIKRRDKIFAYQLAVVVDDIAQGVNHVVRGADILNSTPRQIYLYSCFQQPSPVYFHLPLVVDQAQQKYSKTKLSPAIKADKATYWLIQALEHLGQQPPDFLSELKPQEVLIWAIDNWNLNKVGTDPKVYQA
ncbi:tRNA glutamyl-Q(34) synthetase GluQRS [Aliikangiella maris]|uniref:tRNA glutamyl-Q(34) synthetase GluQRS n=2 Tax=Aliikangiella maris TaxID=3162458 RepID=A0ABV2BRM3_9GAMM